jgi:hypothetical protein
MLNRWNERFPASHRWHYENAERTGVQRFHRDFGRGQEAVIGTKYGLPGVPGQPQTAAEVKLGTEQMIERWSRAAERGASLEPMEAATQGTPDDSSNETSG